MSYSLIYDKQFIKAEKEGKEVFFPMFYGGSSNLFECRNRGNGRRVRSWYNSTYVLKGKRFGTLEEMIESVEAERLELIERNKENMKNYGESWGEYSDKAFGYYASLAIGGHSTIKTTFGMYKGLFVTGCKNALTVEQLRGYGISISLKISVYGEEEKMFKEAGKEEKHFHPKTSKELIEKVEEFEEYLKDTPYVSLSIDFYGADERTMKRIRKNNTANKEKKPKVRKEVDQYFVVKDTLKFNYIIKATRGGYRYSLYGKARAKTFEKESQAKKYADNLNKKYGEEGRFAAEIVHNHTVLLV